MACGIVSTVVVQNWRWFVGKVEFIKPAAKAIVIEIDHDRDSKLTDFGIKTLEDRYLLPGETSQTLFARVATAYADNSAHAQRMYDYISRLWFMPATPVLSNGGTNKGLPISCYLNDVEDSMKGIVDTLVENIWLGKHGGGIGTYWGGVRSIDEEIEGVGTSSGIIPWNHTQDAITMAVSQGSQRRGAAAVYIDIHHPEILEFLEIRKASGDFNRKALYLHHGIAVTDEFMYALTEGSTYELRSPKTGKVIKELDAREVWQKILELRLATGEPYLIFSDVASAGMSKAQQMLGMKVKQSNLCAEIMLHTGKDHLGHPRTAVCCLSSVNAEYFMEWRNHPMFIEDCMRFLDNVLQDYIDRAPPSMWRAIYSAGRERSVGLGLMGFHSFLQQMSIPFESAPAKSWNMIFFKHLQEKSLAASQRLAFERGACPDNAEVGIDERFCHRMALAPTASISIICGSTSACIEPIPANIYTHKTASGSFVVKNPNLEKILIRYEMNTSAIWDSILEHEGSVQHLDFLTTDERDIYKTAFELDQRWIIEMGADRASMICQGQSLNVFLPGDVDKWDLHMLHYTAWEKGIKSLYYVRSKSVQRADHAGAAGMEMSNVDGSFIQSPSFVMRSYDPDECLSCQ